jgi:hypothetical protein
MKASILGKIPSSKNFLCFTPAICLSTPSWAGQNFYQEKLGLRQKISRTEFPPPPELHTWGFWKIKNDNGLCAFFLCFWFSPGKIWFLSSQHLIKGNYKGWRFYLEIMIFFKKKMKIQKWNCNMQKTLTAIFFGEWRKVHWFFVVFPNEKGRP